jgi:putative ABC transport system ATP-binding protein
MLPKGLRSRKLRTKSPAAEPLSSELLRIREMRSSPILRTEHLTRVVSGRRLVDDISIEVERGDVLAVVGPSGSGKTSFLRLLNRLDEPTTGTVYLDGADYRSISPRELRRRVGMVTQTAFLFPGTVEANLRFGPEQRSSKHGSQREQPLDPATLVRLLDEVGLAGYAERDTANLSGGEAQRVSLARALANFPEALLLDEPTSALDDAAKQEVEGLILEVVRHNALTCVIVTHDLAQAARMANRALVLAAGKLQQIGSVEEVLDAQRNRP